MKTTTIKNFAGLEYLVIKNVPIRHTAAGDVLAVKRGFLEELAAKYILENKLPLRGKEVKLLRSARHLSMVEFGKQLGVTHNAVMNWEHEGSRRLLPVNELAVRLFFLSEFNLDFPKSFEDVKCYADLPKKKVILKVAA
ncbi:MAG: hypothetical protein HQK50_11725 [Oligoflexia bacterium]|nr:hypothetical protein [Oligoflexia bacterium]MBF0366233.1 hypothetical protein [Oligoflexia bacterium]